MTEMELRSLLERMRIADKRTADLLTQEMPRRGKGREAFLALLHQQAVSHALAAALQQEALQCQLLRLAYASKGDTVH